MNFKQDDNLEVQSLIKKGKIYSIQEKEKPRDEEVPKEKATFPRDCSFLGSFTRKFRVQLPKFRAAQDDSLSWMMFLLGDSRGNTCRRSMNASSVFAYPLLSRTLPAFLPPLLDLLFFFLRYRPATPTNRVSNKVRRGKNDAQDQRTRTQNRELEDRVPGAWIIALRRISLRRSEAD